MASGSGKIIRLSSAQVDLRGGHAPECVEFTHAVLAQVGLPRSRTEARTFERRSGQTAIFLEAGHGPDAMGRMMPLPLPYGAHPRLLLIHMASEAVRTKDPVIDVGSSIRSFFARLNLSFDGPTLRHFKRQLHCLSASHMTLVFPKAGRIATAKVDPIERFDGWLSLDPSQKSLWKDTLELSPRFYETLIEHAVPLNARAVHALQGSALSLDAYTWLAHRLCRVRSETGVTLHWHSLREQFGQEYREPKNFKREFKKALGQALSVYPDAKVEVVSGGLKLHSSPPPIPKTTIVVNYRETVPSLKPETLEKARTLAPGWDKYVLESTWREWQKGKAKPINADAAFLGWVGAYTKGQKPA